QFREVVRMIDEPILQPIYDLESPRMAFGRVAIIGDAAFVARPHVAAGVAKAADDAAALAAALEAGGGPAAPPRLPGAAPPGGAAPGWASAPRGGRGPSALFSRPRSPPRSGPVRSATAFPKRCWRRPRCSTSCGRDPAPSAPAYRRFARRRFTPAIVSSTAQTAAVSCSPCPLRIALRRTGSSAYHSGFDQPDERDD